MTVRKKEIKKEVIVTNVGSKGENVILTLSFTRPRFEEPTEQILDRAIEPIPKSQAEKMGRDYAKGVMDVMQKQLQTHAQQIAPIFPSRPSPYTFQITLSKQEYEEIGKPTVFDKLTLKLRP